MNSIQVRQAFLDFFGSKQHKIVDSAPMVVKNDPTLMFTNAGMNQFKDIFLGNAPASFARVANSQKCLRVSGKHNDLEEVGHDTYHHTMFEMLGNWSFGDYFKKEAIAWAWELLTDVYGLEPDRLYASVFGGDPQDGLAPDQEAFELWKQILPEDRILFGSKKDNFWEMGETGPCGPCSELHIDLRPDDQRRLLPGRELVNRDHPQVVEIWNLVFIEFNRLSNGQLKPLPAKHIDTGMGFERLCMALQRKQSNYDTDVFQPYIASIAEMAGIAYGQAEMSDVAMRVVADHLRAVAFAIADGELPSNNKGGYVIRRILRRAIRYGYTFLNFREPFVFRLVPVLVKHMGGAYPELGAQQDFISKVISEEEQSFLRTLAQGIQKFEQYILSHPGLKIIDGQFAFELFDTYGFPIDLTSLMAQEQGWQVDMEGFTRGMEAQKQQSRAAATIQTGDWVELAATGEETRFLGYESLQAEVSVVKYRQVTLKGETYYQIVLDQTPFYAESGGQVGDRGELMADGKRIQIIDTQKENKLIVHIAREIPQDFPPRLLARVDEQKRELTANNHTATHLLHAALKIVLGDHVQQKGSLVNEDRLRFDFAHFGKMSHEEILRVEGIVNDRIRENISMEEHRDIPLEEAKGMGAVALFGEKYEDKVRVVAFDKEFSAELCGGTHVHATGNIGLFKIVTEGAIASGIRRVEAITGRAAEQYVNQRLETLDQIRALLKNPKDTLAALQQLQENNEHLRRTVEAMQKEQARNMVGQLIESAQKIGDVNFIAAHLQMDAAMAKDLAYEIRQKADRLFLVLGHEADGKPGLTIMISESLVKEKGLHAGNIVRELAKNIQGGGGGQPFFATAGGKNPQGIQKALEQSRMFLEG